MKLPPNEGGRLRHPRRVKPHTGSGLDDFRIVDRTYEVRTDTRGGQEYRVEDDEARRTRTSPRPLDFFESFSTRAEYEYRRTIACARR